jgi:hypothetical protein
MQAKDERKFLQDVLKVAYTPQDSIQPDGNIQGLGLTASYYHYLNEDHYAATHPDVIQPLENAILAMQYGNGLGAAVGYQGSDYRSFTMGFPFECISNEKTRNAIMRGILNYIIK